MAAHDDPIKSADQRISGLFKHLLHRYSWLAKLTAAKDLLRHGDIAITAAHYIDRPKKATSGLGALLNTKRKGRKIVQFKDDAMERLTKGKVS